MYRKNRKILEWANKNVIFAGVFNLSFAHSFLLRFKEQRFLAIFLHWKSGLRKSGFRFIQKKVYKYLQITE